MTITGVDEKFMREALAEARAAAAVGEVPIGAVVVRAARSSRGRIIAASSTRILRRMPSLRPCAPPLGRLVAGAFPIARST